MIPRLDGLAYGGDYNPDQWPEGVWPEDIRLMQRAGVNLVTVGVFSWSHLEPEEGRFDFGWLDRVLQLLHEGGILVDLATATASPPPWLSHKHPEMLPVLADGVRLWPGARQHYCPSSPIYREASRRLVEALAARYASHPALALWHVGNEFGCHVAACYCDESARDFRRWLRERYHTVAELNAAWGTSFWSQRYSSFDEILPPRRTPTWPNPTQVLDFARFSSDALLQCHKLELAVLKQQSPTVPVTTNFMNFFKPVNYWDWAPHEDIVSNDNYPDPADSRAGMRAAMACDLMRSLKHGAPWILMEQTPSRVNWRPVNIAKAPGQMRLWSYQAVARGAEGIMFFQWRQSVAGAEKFHSAIVPHGAVESSPTWKEVAQLGSELRQLSLLRGSRVPASVGIVFDWESWWALELPSKPSTEIRMLDQLESYYEALFDASITADFVHPDDELGRYKLLLVPNLYLVSEKAAASLRAYVRGGGRVVMSFFSGIVDPNDHVYPGGYPAPFRDLLGLTVIDFLPLLPQSPLSVRWGDGTISRASHWSEIVSLEGAQVIAEFAEGELAGRPAVTRHGFGNGNIHYLATRIEAPAMAELLARVAGEAGVSPVLAAPAGVEAVNRRSSQGEVLFVLNHLDRPVEVTLPQPAENLLDPGARPSPSIRLDPRGVAILRQAASR